MSLFGSPQKKDEKKENMGDLIYSLVDLIEGMGDSLFADYMEKEILQFIPTPTRFLGIDRQQALETLQKERSLKLSFEKDVVQPLLADSTPTIEKIYALLYNHLKKLATITLQWKMEELDNMIEEETISACHAAKMALFKSKQKQKIQAEPIEPLQTYLKNVQENKTLNAEKNEILKENPAFSTTLSNLEIKKSNLQKATHQKIDAITDKVAKGFISLLNRKSQELKRSLR